MLTGRVVVFLAVALVLSSFSTGYAQTVPSILFDRSYGGSRGDYLNGITPLADGGILVGGYSNSGTNGTKTALNRTPSLSGSEFDDDYWVLRIDENGNQQSDQTYGGGYGDVLTSIVTTTDGGFLLGGHSRSPASGNKTAPSRDFFQGSASDYWLVKIGPSGSIQWDQSYGGDFYDNLTDVAPTSDGGYLLVGYSNSSHQYGNKTAVNRGSYDFWVVSIDTGGAIRWQQTYGGSGNDLASVVLRTTDGGYLIGGSSGSGTNGNKTAMNRGGTDYWIVKMDANGNTQWDQSYGGIQDDSLGSILAVSDGGYILVGKSNSGADGNKSTPSLGAVDGWVVKIDAGGSKQWDRSFGGTTNDSFASALITSDGGLLLGGTSASGNDSNKTSANRGGSDFWIVKTDASGNRQWEQTYGGASDDTLTSLTQTTDGKLLLGGWSQSAPSGNKTSTNWGFVDYWVLKIAGNVPPQIAGQPQSQVASASQNVTFTVDASSFTQPISFQWFFNGTNIAGATNSILTLSNVQATNAGSYYVVVSNDYGSIESSPAILTYTDAASLLVSVHASLTIFGTTGRTYRVEYSDDINGPVNWTTLTNITLQASPQLWVDASQPATGSKRFYRVLLEP